MSSTTPLAVRMNINEAGKLMWIVISLCVLSSLVVLLRMWVRLRMTKQGVGADDIFIIAASILHIAETALICITTNYGLGRHMEYVEPWKIAIFFKFAYVEVLLYITVVFAIKTSLILFYIRLIPSASSRYFHAWCWGYIGLNSTLGLTFTVLAIFSCSPIPYYWDRSIPGGKCLNLGTAYLVSACCGVFTDLAALLLPIQTVWNLNMQRKRKVQFIGLFSTGFFVCIASFIRMTTLLSFGSYTDPTFTMVKSDIWSMIEINIGIITVCAPINKVFATRYLWPKIAGCTYRSSANGSGGRSHQHKQHDPARTFGSNGQNSSSRQHFEAGIYKAHDLMVTIDNEMDHYVGHTGKTEAGSTENLNEERNSPSPVTRGNSSGA